MNENQVQNENQAQNENAPVNSEEKKPSLKAKILKEAREWIVALAFALIVVGLLTNFAFTLIRVDGHSMDDTLADGERLFVNVAGVKFGTVNREDVVICRYPDRGRTNFVKRVVAVPGDSVYRKDGITHVVTPDGVDTALDPYYTLYYFPSPDYEAYTLGEDEYFVVGDNRYNSHDSRDWNDSDPSNDVGPITKDMIRGRVVEVIWPLDSIRSVE